MPTYHEILTTDLSTLTTAADRWDGMAAELKKQETAYERDVHGITLRPAWTGQSQQAANARFGTRLKEFRDAQTEAKAIASLLRDAHTQFAGLRTKLEAARDDAVAKGLAVTDRGEVWHDASRLSQQDRIAYAHDVDEQKAVTSRISSFQARIDHCVRAVNDADGGVEVAFGAVVQGPVWNDGFGPEFNGEAQGDVEAYEEKEAEDIADRVRSGDATPADYRELRRLLADNSHDRVFSQTLLDHLGAKGTVELSNTLEGLAHQGGPQHGSPYLDTEKGLATVLATATQDPDSAFTDRFRAQMREVGTEQFTIDGVGLPGEKVRGYQSLVTLMQQGSGYNGKFLEDTADDIRHAEESYVPEYGKPGSLWSMDEKIDGEDDGWFANDPLDGMLGIMSHDPATSAEYLDPDLNDNLDYLVDKRDWDVVVDHYATPPGGYTTGMPVMAADGDDRLGFGNALTAAATGVDPDTSGPVGPTVHTDANNRIFKHALGALAGQGDDMPASLRDDMAKIMINHGHETYTAMSDPSGNTQHPADGPRLDQGKVLEMTKQISRSQESYGILHEGMNYAIMDDINDPSRNPEDTLNSAGNAVGFMEQGRYLALKGDLRDLSWDKMASYHGSGVVLNLVSPVYGDALQRGADILTSEWVADEARDQQAQLTADNQDVFRLRQNQLNSIAEQWYDTNPHWADTHTGFSREQGIYQTVQDAANDGNKRASGLAGDQ